MRAQLIRPFQPFERAIVKFFLMCYSTGSSFFFLKDQVDSIKAKGHKAALNSSNLAGKGEVKVFADSC